MVSGIIQFVRKANLLNLIFRPSLAFVTTDPFFLDARIVVNARASYAVRLWARPVTLQMLVNNVFDKFYFPSSNGPADPTSFRLSAECRF